MKNLLKVTDNFKNTYNFTVDCGMSCDVISNDTYGSILNINNETKDYAHLKSKEQIKLKGGKTYCFSFLGKSAWIENYVMVNNEWKTIKTEWTRCEVVLKPKEDENYSFEITLSSQNHIWATQFQLEEGDKFTSFESGGQTTPVPPTPPAKKYGTIAIQYMDYDTGITIADDYTIKGEVGTNYNIDKKNINNYEFYYNTGDMNGVFSEGSKTIYLYYKKKESPKPTPKYGKVIVQYLNYKTGTEIAESKTIEGKVGETFDIQVKQVNGYKYYYAPNGMTGKFTEKDQTIYLYYNEIEQPTPSSNVLEIANDDKYEKALLITNKKDGIENIIGETNINLEVNQVYIFSYYAKSDYDCTININGQDIPISSYGKEDSITFIAKENAKFKLSIKIRDNRKIKFANFKIEKKEEILNNGKVIVNYTDYDTNNIIETQTLQGKIGANYNIKNKQIPNYDFYYFGDSETGKFTKKNITVTVFYKKKEVPEKYGTINVEYVDDDTQSTLSSANLKNKVGMSYVIEKKSFDGYEFVKSSESLTGVFVEGDKTVSLYYKKSTKPTRYGKVTIKYLDYNNQNSISANTVLTGITGSNYNIEIKSINGYDYAMTYDNLKGVYSDYEQVITLYYKKNEEKPTEYGSVIVKYIDVNTNREISNSNTLQGEVETNYNAAQKDIKGYIYDYSSDGLNGVFTKTTKTIILYYRKQNQDKKYGKIIIEYIDSKTNKKICQDDVITGEIGLKYNIQEKKINGYKYAYSYNVLSGNFVKENESIQMYYNSTEKPEPKPPIPIPTPEPSPSPTPVPIPVLQGTIATNQFTIIDMNDALITNLAPNNPTKHCLWLDTSVNPPVLKIWDGHSWVIVNDYNDNIKDLQDQINNNQGQVVEQIKTVKETQSKDASDVQKLKDKITTLITHDDMTKITQTIGSRIDNVVVETNQNKQLITQTASGTKSELSGINNKVTTITDRQYQSNKKVSEEIKDLTNKNVIFEKSLDGVKGQISNVEIMTNNNLNETNTKIADVIATTDNIKGQIHSLDKKTFKEIDGVKDIVNQNISGINILKGKVQSVVETTNTEEIQKMINGKLIDVGKRIDSNSNKIEQAKTSLSAEISDIHGVMKTDMSNLNSKVTKINADLNHVGANITHVTNEVNDIKTQTASLNVSINGINSKVGEKFKTIEDNVGSLKSNISGNYTEINQLKDRVQNIVVNNNVEEFTKKINGQMDAVVSQNNKNKQWIETTGSGMSRKIEGVQTEITQVKNKNGELEGKFNTVNNRTLDFKTTLDGFNGEIKSIKDSASSIDTKISKIKATNDIFSVQLSDVSQVTKNTKREVLETNSKIQQLSDQISTKVSKGELQSQMVETQKAFKFIIADKTSDIKTGITQVNQNGVRVDHNNTGTYTNMSADGFVIADKEDNRVIASFGMSDNGSMSRLQVNDIDCPVVGKYFPWGNADIYVCAGGRNDKSGRNWDNASGSIESALNYFRKDGVFLRDGQTINVHIDGGIYNTDVKLFGFYGNGAIKLSFSNNSMMKGVVYISDCTCSIIVDGGSKYNGAILKNPDNNSMPCFHVIRSTGTYIRNIRHKGNNNNDFIYSEFSKVSVSGCDISSCKNICYTSTCSNVSLRDNIGSYNGLYGTVEDGGLLSVSLNAPYAAHSEGNNIGNNWGGIGKENISKNVLTQFNGKSSSYQRLTATFYASGYRSFRKAEQWRNGMLYQGGNNEFGSWQGHCQVKCQDWCKKSNNENNISGRIWLRRKSVKHGIDGQADIYLCSKDLMNNFGRIGSLSRGEFAWFSLPYQAIKQIINGDGIVFYNTHQSDYIQFDNNVIIELSGDFNV